jgi:K+-sensing histidine kinase KdpD
MAVLRPWLGIGICVGVAVLLCRLLSDSADSRFIAPALALQAVIVAALSFGRISALIGSVAASLIFILFLFPPLGSMVIRDRVEMTMLLLFQAASIVIAVISPRLRWRRLDPFLD